jgi:hypothetical protein
MIKFVLMVNKMGQTRVSSYYEWLPIPERVALEVRHRDQQNCSLGCRVFAILWVQTAILPRFQQQLQ